MDSSDRNIICGSIGGGLSGGYGVQLADYSPGPPSIKAVIQGNFFGTDVTGTIAIGTTSGVAAATDDSVLDNVISGCSGHAMVVYGDDVFQGNRIGTDVTGTKALGNVGTGIQVDGSDNTIGGTSESDLNVISANQGSGIYMVTEQPFRGDNVNQGNRIGTDISGRYATPNGGDGIYALDSSYNLIGGTEPGAGNVISGNMGSGVVLVDYGGSSHNILEGNFIGTSFGGTEYLSNHGDGIDDYAGDATIGGSSPAQAMLSPVISVTAS